MPLERERNTVVVTDVEIPFGSMVVLMVKWALASIPALLILALSFGALFLAFAAFAGVFRAFLG